MLGVVVSPSMTFAENQCAIKLKLMHSDRRGTVIRAAECGKDSPGRPERSTGRRAPTVRVASKRQWRNPTRGVTKTSYTQRRRNRSIHKTGHSRRRRKRGVLKTGHNQQSRNNGVPKTSHIQRWSNKGIRELGHTRRRRNRCVSNPAG